MGIKKRSSGKKAKKLLEQNIIDLDDKKEKRRQELRAAAEQSRKKHGRKSLKQTMMDEVAADELYSGKATSVPGYTLRDAVEGSSGTALVRGKAVRSARKKGLSAYMKILIVVAAVVFLTLVMSVGQIVSLKIQEAEAEERVAQLREQKEKLEASTAEIGTDASIEKQARSWLKMAKQGETLYIIGEERGTSLSAVQETDESKE